MTHRTLATVSAFAGLLTAAAAQAAPTIIQPNEAASRDTWVYAFFPLANTNLNGGGFENVLASAKAQITGQSHELRSLIAFDVAGVSVDADEVATINLYVTDATSFTSFIENPSPAKPIVVDAFAVTSTWDEGNGASGVTWNTQPSYAATAFDSVTIDRLDQWVSFDVTSLMNGWISDPSSNNGIALVARELVPGTTAPQQIAAAYVGAGFMPVPQLRPFLQVSAVPEPATLGLLSAGALVLSRRRRSR